jgi:hypothetical protein
MEPSAEQKIADLERHIRSLEYVNVELCKAVNERKYRQLLNYLFEKAQQEKT